MKIKFYLGALLALTVITVLNAKAQDAPATYSTSTHLSIGIGAAKPIGSFGDSHNFGIGGSIQVEVPVAENIFVTANAGYNKFTAKDGLRYTNFDSKQPIANVIGLNMIPVKIGAKIFPVDVLYIQAEVGITSLLKSNELRTDRSALFTYAPQIGTQLSTGSNSKIDIGIRYETTQKFYTGADNNKFIALQVAYSFGL